MQGSVPMIRDREVKQLQHLLNCCPLLRAFYDETLRFHSTNSSNRRVVEEASVGGYTLKVGNNIICPPHAQHHSEEFFGRGTDKFDPERFIKPVLAKGTQRWCVHSEGVCRSVRGGSSQVTKCSLMRQACFGGMISRLRGVGWLVSCVGNVVKRVVEGFPDFLAHSNFVISAALFRSQCTVVKNEIHPMHMRAMCPSMNSTFPTHLQVERYIK
jgi:hypothetical protein